jgi:hypothetical protein
MPKTPILFAAPILLAMTFNTVLSAQQPAGQTPTPVVTPSVGSSDKTQTSNDSQSGPAPLPGIPCPVVPAAPPFVPGFGPPILPPHGSLLPPVLPGPGFAACQPAFGESQDAFRALPETRLIPVMDNANEPRREDDASTVPESPAFVQAVFSEPAHFSGAGYAAPAQSLVIIYEGMTVLVYPDGRYSVRFVAEVPDLPVTVRLQFRVDRITGPAGTITLPPITFSADEYNPRHAASQSWSVRHDGYSPLLLGLCSNCADCRFSRDGMARFGSLPLQPADLIPSPTLGSLADSRPKRFCNSKIFLD